MQQSNYINQVRVIEKQSFKMKIVINELQKYDYLNGGKQEINDIPNSFLGKNSQQNNDLYNAKRKYN